MRPDSPADRKRGVYTIDIDGEWSLEDLYIFPHTFEQVYFLTYSLFTDHDEYNMERIQRAYSAFPWRGGYSAVSFSNTLKYIVPRPQRPELVSINYSSPGLMEIGLILAVAVSVGKIVKSVAKSIDTANATYGNVMKGMQERKLLRLEERRRELNLRRSEMKYIEESLGRMAGLLGFDNIKEMNERTGNAYVSLKILLSLYRRLRTLADYERKWKAIFPIRRRGR